jgi:hypothetical protein
MAHTVAVAPLSASSSSASAKEKGARAVTLPTL